MTSMASTFASIVLTLGMLTATPESLEAQVRQRDGVTRATSTTAYKPYGGSCLAEKVIILGGMTGVGALMGFLVWVISYPFMAFNTTSYEPVGRVTGVFAIMGLAGGVVLAAKSTCPIRANGIPFLPSGSP